MTGPGVKPGAEPDPSMDDILASIRRILSEEEQAVTPPPADDVLDLDDSMLVTPPAPSSFEPSLEPHMPEPADHPKTVGPTIVAPEAEAATTNAMGSLRRTIEARATLAVNRGGAGPTLEDIVRDELRPVLKAWLDNHLPPLVERLVAAEIERLVARSAS